MNGKGAGKATTTTEIDGEEAVVMRGIYDAKTDGTLRILRQMKGRILGDSLEAAERSVVYTFGIFLIP